MLDASNPTILRGGALADAENGLESPPGKPYNIGKRISSTRKPDPSLVGANNEGQCQKKTTPSNPRSSFRKRTLRTQPGACNEHCIRSSETRLGGVSNNAVWAPGKDMRTFPGNGTASYDSENASTNGHKTEGGGGLIKTHLPCRPDSKRTGVDPSGKEIANGGANGWARRRTDQNVEHERCRINGGARSRECFGKFLKPGRRNGRNGVKLRLPRND